MIICNSKLHNVIMYESYRAKGKKPRACKHAVTVNDVRQAKEFTA